jgi:peptidoglycan/xylan/chitin deacetylase (PgdA/CDA1 family)
MNIKASVYKYLTKPGRILSNIIDSPALILLYHRVIDLENDPQQLAVTPANFRLQIEYLKKNYNLVSISEFYQHLSGRKGFPGGTIILSFDDGYFDNYEYALPILEEYNSQAVFYISTGLLNTNKMTWWDDIQNIFLSDHPLPAELPLNIGENKLLISTSDKNQQLDAYNKLHHVLKYMRSEQREIVINSLYKWADLVRKGKEFNRFMTYDELKSLSASGSAVIGAHTQSHTPLSILSYDEQFKEITHSKNELESLIKKPVEHFSYPYGLKKDFNKESKKICRELGFKMVCANYPSQVHKWSDHYSLPRFLVRNWDIAKFKTEINSFFKY